MFGMSNSSLIGNSTEEQGIYKLEGAASIFGYSEEYGTCTVLVKWSGDYGVTPHFDFGTVFNNTRHSKRILCGWNWLANSSLNTSPDYITNLTCVR